MKTDFISVNSKSLFSKDNLSHDENFYRKKNKNNEVFPKQAQNRKNLHKKIRIDVVTYINARFIG